MNSLLLLAFSFTHALSVVPFIAGAVTNATSHALSNITVNVTAPINASISKAGNISNSNQFINSTENVNATSGYQVSNIKTTLANAFIPGATSDNATDVPVSANNVSSTRGWIGVLMPLDGEATVIQNDPFRNAVSIEVDPFRFTEMPSANPSSTPSTEPTALPTSPPTPRPTIWKENSIPRNADQSYFDYNPDSRYGPGEATEIEVSKELSRIMYKNNNWRNVKDSSEEKYWMPLQKDIKFSLKDNACSNSRQSPIDIWPSEEVECEEHHQIRHRPGDFRIDGSDHIEKQILPSKLRLVFPRREGEEPDPPYADFPKCVLFVYFEFSGIFILRIQLIYQLTLDGNYELTVSTAFIAFFVSCFPFLSPYSGFGEFVDALHADIKIPSEHWVRGKQYVAEYQLYHLHLGRDRAPVISVMVDLHPDGEPNFHLQRAIDEWQKVFDADKVACQEERRRAARRLGGFFEAYPFRNTSASEESRRKTQETTERKIWDPYHPEILPSIHFYGYSGSLTEPPCTDFIEWRVIDKPMLISPEQLLQMQTLLFNHVDNKCRLTSNHFEGSVARPIQDASRRPVYQCTCRDFLADDDERRVCTRREFRLQNTEAEAEAEDAGEGE